MVTGYNNIRQPRAHCVGMVVAISHDLVVPEEVIYCKFVATLYGIVCQYCVSVLCVSIVCLDVPICPCSC